MIASPLEQFEILSIYSIKLGNLNLSFSNSSLLIILSALAFVFIFTTSLSQGTIVPNPWQSFVEMSYEFILNLIVETVGEKGQRFFPFIFVTFMFLLFCNLLGMVPYSFTITSHLIVTFGLALSIFIGINIVGFMNHGLHFFSLFLPKGAPLFLAPFLILIELISYVFRVVSLAVRLFANMMSGHTLLKILAGFAWTMLTMGGFLAVASLIPLGIVFCITGLEIGIAILQAYVFTILVCIYLNDAINLH